MQQVVDLVGGAGQARHDLLAGEAQHGLDVGEVVPVEDVPDDRRHGGRVPALDVHRLDEPAGHVLELVGLPPVVLDEAVRRAERP